MDRVEALALAPYPVSRDFTTRFETATGAHPRILQLAELRALPTGALLRKLRSLASERFYLLLEDETSRALLPVLHGIAALTRARRIEAVLPDLTREPLPRWRVVASLAGLVQASISGQRAVARSRREVEALARVPRLSLEAEAPGEGAVLYLKSTLALGLRAGGSVGHTAGVVNAFVAGGREVDFVSAETPIGIDERVRRVAIPPPASYGLPAEANLHRFQHAFAEHATNVARERANARPFAFVYHRLSPGSHAGVTVSRAARLPLVLEYNGPEAWAAQHWGTPLRYGALAEAAEEQCLRHAHLIVTISEVLRDQLQERGVEPGRIVFHPKGIDPERFDPERFSETETQSVRARHRIAQDATVATFVGTFGDWHGAEVLARAVRLLVQQDPSWLRENRLHFLFVGDGKRMAEVRETLADCAPFYTLAGLVDPDEVPLHLAASDLFVSPHVANPDGTPFFGSPTKLFEYMAIGAPSWRAT